MNDLINFESLSKVLQEYASEAEQIYRNQLASGSKNASKSLADTANAEVVVNDSVYEVVLNLQEYWKYVERGRKGLDSSPDRGNVGSLPSYVPQSTKNELTKPMGAAAFPPVNAIINWIKVKPVVPRPDKNGRVPSVNSLAYLIGRKIAFEGIEPYPALATTIQELDRKYKDRISEALGRDVGTYIAKVLPQ